MVATCGVSHRFPVYSKRDGSRMPNAPTSVSGGSVYSIPIFFSPCNTFDLSNYIELDTFFACGSVLMNIRTYTLVDSSCIPRQPVDYPHVYTLMQHHGRHIANNSLYVQIISKSQTISCIVYLRSTVSTITKFPFGSI